MISCLTIPADTQLIDLAQGYIDCIVAMRKGSQELISTLDILRAEAHRSFEAKCVEHGIEFYDKQDLIDIAAQIISGNIL